MFGRHVNLAARIESYTIGGQILMSEFTRDELDNELQLGESWKIEPKGVQHPITVYDIRGIGAPHDIYIDNVDEDPLITLPEPLPVRLRVLVEKDAGGAEHRGELQELGRRRARLRTQTPIAAHDHILLLVSDSTQPEPHEVYAKAITASDGSVVLHFTSLPEVVQAAFQR